VLARDEINKAAANLHGTSLLTQEPGTRPACAIPYELYADGNFNRETMTFSVMMKAGNTVFTTNAAGSPFIVYAVTAHVAKHDPLQSEQMRAWNYAVSAGESLTDTWQLKNFDEQIYHLRLYGPNGFFREFSGDANDPQLEVRCNYASDSKTNSKLTGDIIVTVLNHGSQRMRISVSDPTYHTISKSISLPAAFAAPGKATFVVPTGGHGGWYDILLSIEGNKRFQKRFAGHVETGKLSKTDPAMA
jgi:phospholipase C